MILQNHDDDLLLKNHFFLLLMLKTAVLLHIFDQLMNRKYKMTAFI